MNDQRVRIIAEAGVNHDGSLARALELVDVAADAGADIVKFQTFRAGLMISRHMRKADYQVRNTGAAESQLEMVRRLELPDEAFLTLADHCRRRGIAFLSTPFDLPSLQFLCEGMRLETVKIGSGEVTNIPFLIECGRRAGHVILSTGMSSLGEVELALGALAHGATGATSTPSRAGLVDLLGSESAQTWLRDRVTLLHCTTEYPAPYASVNLRAMPLLAQAFGVAVGLSDHTPGVHVPLAAVALGATVIEKHFTLDRSLPGPDHAASLDPAQLGELVRCVREVEAAMGTGRKLAGGVELSNRAVARKVLVAARPIVRGERITRDMLAVKRAGRGLEPIDLYALEGTVSTRDWAEDEPVVEAVRAVDA